MEGSSALLCKQCQTASAHSGICHHCDSLNKLELSHREIVMKTSSIHAHPGGQTAQGGKGLARRIERAGLVIERKESSYYGSDKKLTIE